MPQQAVHQREVALTSLRHTCRQQAGRARSSRTCACTVSVPPSLPACLQARRITWRRHLGATDGRWCQATRQTRGPDCAAAWPTA